MSWLRNYESPRCKWETKIVSVCEVVPGVIGFSFCCSHIVHYFSSVTMFDSLPDASSYDTYSYNYSELEESIPKDQTKSKIPIVRGNTERRASVWNAKFGKRDETESTIDVDGTCGSAPGPFSHPFHSGTLHEKRDIARSAHVTFAGLFNANRSGCSKSRASW